MLHFWRASAADNEEKKTIYRIQMSDLINDMLQI